MNIVDKDGGAYHLDVNSDIESVKVKKQSRFFSLSVASGKGGVGKTLTIVNLAMAVSHMGLKVLILDGDFGLANVDVVLGLQGKYHVQDVIAGFASLDEVILQGPNGISLIPSGSGVSELQNLTYTQKQILFQKILYLDMDFDFLLIDTGAGIGDNVLHLNSISDSRLIITTPEPHAITDAYALIKVLAENQGVRTFDLMVNMASSRQEAENVASRIISTCSSFIKINVNYKGFVPLDKNVNRLVMQQNTGSSMACNTIASQAWSHIAQGYVSNYSQTDAHTAVSTFWKNYLCASPGSYTERTS
ncbi:MAG: MinD/ParA family protein [Oligoflexales bacterium]|nr:MinD/ParA family protein [Oligoflexales bacterium]